MKEDFFMFVFNIKVNGSKIFKLFFIGVVIILTIIIGIVIYKILNGANNASRDQSCLPKNNVSKLQPQNYTNVLKSVHENLDNYVGKQINFTGYVYRVLDLKDNQFILARNMIINSNSQYVVVGFLCEGSEVKNLDDGTWVDVTGTITKGDYHGEIPIIKITEMHIVDKPANNEFVYPPDDSYIPTSAIR